MAVSSWTVCQPDRSDLQVRMLGYEEQRLANVLVNPPKRCWNCPLRTSLVQMASSR